jgi:hypothetical protein
VVEPDDLITGVLHAGILDFVTILSFWEVVGWTVNINHSLLVIV